MTTLRHEIRIVAPASRVWHAVAGDLTAVRHYNAMVASARLVTEQRQGIGATRRCELRPRGFVEERVREWSPGRAISLEVVASEWPVEFMRWRTELEEQEGATHVVQEMSYRVKFGLLGAALDAIVMRRKLDRSIQEVFAALKRYVEAHDDGGAPAA